MSIYSVEIWSFNHKVPLPQALIKSRMSRTKYLNPVRVVADCNPRRKFFSGSYFTSCSTNTETKVATKVLFSFKSNEAFAKLSSVCILVMWFYSNRGLWELGFITAIRFWVTCPFHRKGVFHPK